MGRRIRWLGLVIVVCFALVLLQLVNIQVRQGNALADNPNNPRNQGANHNNLRGRILAADGTVLAYSVPAPAGSTFKYQRVYPPKTASLFSGIVGYYSYFYGTSGIENYYDGVLKAHKQGPQSFSQFLSGQTNTGTDDITLTVQPSIQQAAMNALLSNPNSNKDGAVVALDPRNGNVLAMASNPTFDPNPLASADITTEKNAGTVDFQTKDPEGAYAGVPLATFNTYAPGSTFKVVTSAAVYNLVPSLINFSWPPGGGEAGCTTPGEIPEAANPICNDAGTPQNASACGGTMTQMLPQSCDPGYAVLGLNVGANSLYQQANLFGYNAKPPIDLNSNLVSASSFPTPAQLAPGQQGPPGLAFAAFGQGDVQATALQNAMVAAGIADNGTVMTPHFMAEIRNSQGGLVQLYQPKVYKQATSASAAQQVNQLMQGVVANGTATQVGFDPADDVAAKTGTAQTGPNNSETNDWMIAFAPANNPVVAVAVVVPYQPVSASGAEVAGPIMKAVIEAALAVEHHSSGGPITTTTTAPSNAPQQPATTTTGSTAPPVSTTTTTAPPPTTTQPAPTSTLPTTPLGKP